MIKYHVVVVGGGFGGTKTALSLARDPRFDVTFICEVPYFSYFPTLYQTATGGRRMVSVISIKEIFNKLPINLISDKVVSIDRKGHTIRTEGNKIFKYDALVLSLGVKTNYFNIKGLEEFSYGIKSIEDAEKLKKHLHQELIDEGKPDLNYVVIGGGPTGVELAGVLPTYLKRLLKQHKIESKQFHIDLVEAAPRLLPRAPKHLSKRVASHLRKLGIKIYLKTAVQAETADALTVDNKPIRSHTVIWTAGVSNNSFYADNAFQLARNGKVRVDQFLQAESGIYVIGDNADTPYSGMAQTAIYDGVFIAKNLQRIAAEQDPKPYRAKKPIYVFSAGHKWAAVVWGPVRLYGRTGGWLRKAADLVGFHDYEPWRLATERVFAESESEETCPICASSLNRTND